MAENKRWLTAPVAAQIAVSALALVVGLYLGATTLFVRDAPAAVASAQAAVTGLRTELGAAGRYSPARRVQFASFDFADATGAHWGGEDAVSDIYAAQHPVGSAIVVYFHPDDPGHAVIGMADRLDAPKSLNLAVGAGLGLIILGALGVFMSVEQARFGKARAAKH